MQENSNANISDLISRQADLRPDAIAIYYGEDSLSYKQLDLLVWKIANYLNENGVRKGDVLAHMFDDELTLFISMFSTARLGATVFSVSASTPVMLRDEMLSKAKTKFIVTNLNIDLKNIFLDRNLLHKQIDIDTSIKDMIPIAPWLIITGSGSTGHSKLIPVNHKQCIARIRSYNELVSLSCNDRVSSLIHLDYATPKHQLLHALSKGASVVLFDKNELKNAALITQWKITVLYSVVVHLEKMLKALPNYTTEALPFIKRLITSGSTVSQSLRESIRQRLTDNLHIIYGTNEAWIVTHSKEKDIKDSKNSVGYPCKNVKIEIVDSNNKQLSRGKVGLVRLKSAGMVEGYIGEKKATTRAFKNGWFYPGDLGMLNKDGQLLYYGRADHMMIMDGINIYPAEIEAALTQHPCVLDAAAMPMKHLVHQDIPVCAIVLYKDATVSVKELMDFAYQRLGPSGPREIIVADKIPRNKQGKLIRAELAQIISQKLEVKHEQSKKTILVMFSGGLDSTYMLYHYLMNTNYKIHVHHISMRYPSEPRWQEEDTATRKIINVCQKIRSFQYSESRVDFGFYHYVGRDSDTQLLMASKVAPNIKGPVSLALGWLYSDHLEDLENGRAENKVTEKLWEALCNSIDKKFGDYINREILLPLVEMKLNKKELITQLPKELLELTWSCRKPQKSESGVSIPCGKCHPCRAIKKVLDVRI